MKRAYSNKTGKTSKGVHQSEARDEELQWLDEIQTVLSPYWSARSGYREDVRNAAETDSDTNT